VSDAAGRVVALASDESWRAVESPAQRSETAAMSFALNPAEVLDARAEAVGWAEPGFDDTDWPHAVACANADHWGPLRARSIPLLDERTVRPRRRVGTWVARAVGNEEIYSFLVASSGRRMPRRVAAMTYIHSPRAQEVTLGAWWGRYWLNGRELTPTVRRDVSLRQDFPAELEAGWNRLEVHETIGHDAWDFHLAVPAEGALAVSAERELDSPNTFLVAGPWGGEAGAAAEAMDLPVGEPSALDDELGPWRRWPRDRSAESPCRERAWKTFESLCDDASPRVDVSAFAERVGAETLAVLLDFGEEVLGRPVLDFSAAAGTVVDLTYTEQLAADGTADVHGRFFVDMGDRRIARAGRQRWHVFHPRGFRYLEVLVRGDLSSFDLHDLAVTRASYPAGRGAGRFECSDPVLNDVWRLGQATLDACMEDAYLDCPWRERGLYSGDFLVQFHVNLAARGDTALFRRCIGLFLDAQGDNGLIPGGCHGLPPGRHPDYSAVLLQAAWAYWARTGDTETLGAWAPRLRKLIDGLGALRGAGRTLLDGAELDSYIDLSHGDRGGVSCALNCFLQRAFHDAGRLFDVLGDAPAAEAYAAEAERLAAAIREGFWNDERGAFIDRLASDVPDAGPSVPGNALPVLYGIATDAQARRAVEFLAEALRNNFRVSAPAENSDCNVTSYFAFYALGALYRLGRIAEAEAFMRTYWGRMLDAGAWTCWEYFVDKRGASRCHAWSASPTHFLSRCVLGVTLPEPGNANVVAIRPQPGTLDWAEGQYPHPAGPIGVRWEVKAGKLRIDVDAPESVTVIADD